MSRLRADPSRAGYLLFEALVAIAVAGLVVAAFVQTNMVARKAAQLPHAIVGPYAAAQTLLRNWLADPDGFRLRGNQDGFDYRAKVEILELVPRSTKLAPPLLTTALPRQQQPVRSVFELQQLHLVLSTPDRRPLELETIGVIAR